MMLYWPPHLVESVSEIILHPNIPQNSFQQQQNMGLLNGMGVAAFGEVQRANIFYI